MNKLINLVQTAMAYLSPEMRLAKKKRRMERALQDQGMTRSQARREVINRLAKQVTMEKK
jgi:hypothetical protein